METDPLGNAPPPAPGILVAQSKELSVAADTGAVYKPIHVTRAVKICPIQQHELENLSDLSNESTLWSSISAALLFMIVDRGWDMLVMPKGQQISSQQIGSMILAVVVCIFGFIRAYSARRTIKERLTKIESEIVEQK